LTVRVERLLTGALEPISTPEMDEVIRQTFGRGLVKWPSGSLPVRVSVDQQNTYIPEFDATAIGARLDVIRNGKVARQLEIWWFAGAQAIARQNAWEVPMLDDNLLVAPLSDDDVWQIRVRSAPELALRIEGAEKYWEGDLTIDVPVILPRFNPNGSAPSRGWIPESDPIAQEAQPATAG
jgi:hypothetical protein